MVQRFIKYIPGEEAQWLLENYPNAHLLLTLIAIRARRISGHPDGLLVGDAMIGDHKSAGLSRQQYRTALAKLVELKHIEIVYNGKKFLKREKSTIKTTIQGTLVTLIKSTIYDINPTDTNHDVNQRPTNDQPTTNHEQERKRMNKNNVGVASFVSSASRISERDEKKSLTSENLTQGLQKMKYPLTKTIKTPNGQEIMASLEEYFAYAVRSKLDYSTPEIEEAWMYLCQYPSEISHWINFLSYRIDKKRNIKKLETKKERQKCRTLKHLKTREAREEAMKRKNRVKIPVRSSSKIYNLNVSENDMSGQVLQDLVYQQRELRESKSL